MLSKLRAPFQIQNLKGASFPPDGFCLVAWLFFLSCHNDVFSFSTNAPHPPRSPTRGLVLGKPKTGQVRDTLIVYSSEAAKLDKCLPIKRHTKLNITLSRTLHMSVKYLCLPLSHRLLRQMGKNKGKML